MDDFLLGSPQSSANAVVDSLPVDRTLLEEEAPSDTFLGNLAETLSSSTLASITSTLLDGIERDKASRSAWEQAYIQGLKNLGLTLEEAENLFFPKGCAAFDTTLTQSLLRCYAFVEPELFPPEGPVHVQILGLVNEALEDQAERVKAWMNWYLTQQDEDYSQDSSRLLMTVILRGCAFRKVFQDPVTHHPVARMIKPQDFLVNNDCVSVLSSDRLTHVFYLDKQELLLRQRNGFYRDIEIIWGNASEGNSDVTTALENLEGIQKESDDKPSLLTLYECHAHLVIEDEEEKSSPKQMPKPYIVTLIPSTRQILSIRRNWEEDDPDVRRIEYFVQYTLFPGFGLYGLGYAQLLGSNVHALTSILRQLIDKGILSNFPGGLRASGLKIPQNDKLIGPGEFVEVNTAGFRSLKDSIIPLPYGEPSVVLKDLYEMLRRQTQELSSAVELNINEQSGNTPVGTMMAQVDVAHRLQSSILKSLKQALSQELGILYRLFGQCLPDTPYPFAVVGGAHQVMRADFNQSLFLAPTGNGLLSTSTQRIAHVQELLKLSSQAPQLFDLKAVYKRACKTLQIENIDEIMPPQQEALPLDPVTENMNAVQGKPLTVALWQDHPAHLAVHGQFAQENPDTAPTLQAHMATHRAYAYQLQMQQALGYALPPLETEQNPQIQNQIAMGAAEIAGQQQATQSQNQPQPVDPNAVLMEDIRAREEGNQLKFAEAQLKAQTEAFKAQLQFEMQKHKLEVEQLLAEQKNAVQLQIESMKHANVEHADSEQGEYVPLSTPNEGEIYGQ
jgi:hypothetical protein